MNLDDLEEQVKQLHNDLKRINALKKGIRPYFEETARQNRKKNIWAIINKLESDWGSSKLEKQDRDFDLVRRYERN